MMTIANLKKRKNWKVTKLNKFVMNSNNTYYLQNTSRINCRKSVYGIHAIKVVENQENMVDTAKEAINVLAIKNNYYLYKYNYQL